MEKSSIVLYSEALSRFRNALNQDENEFIRDSVIIRFEFTFDLAWKVSRKVMGIMESSPRSIIRLMAREGLIADTQIWFDYLEARNSSTDAYQEEITEKVYKIAQSAVNDFLNLETKLLAYEKNK